MSRHTPIGKCHLYSMVRGERVMQAHSAHLGVFFFYTLVESYKKRKAGAGKGKGAGNSQSPPEINIVW